MSEKEIEWVRITSSLPIQGTSCGIKGEKAFRKWLRQKNNNQNQGGEKEK